MPPQAQAMLMEFFNEVFIDVLGSVQFGGSKRDRDEKILEIVDVYVNVVISSEYAYPSLDTAESYSLTLNAPVGSVLQVQISAATYQGARHGLETLSQMISWNALTDLYQIHRTAVIALDGPEYPHRGISIDTARNFMPVDYLKRVIDGMSHNKLNVFHWHLTDGQSFPISLPRRPKLAQYGAYSSSMTYSDSDIRDIVAYAELRGIAVIPELDSPAHAGNGWQFGEVDGLGPLALCVNADHPECPGSGGICNVLNPANPNLMVVLADIYADLVDLFPSDRFHMGGDEVSFRCWQASPEIATWMSDHGLVGDEDDMFDLWEQFQVNASAELTAANGGTKKNSILWTSSLTGADLTSISPDDYAIQIWNKSADTTVTDIVANGFDVIISNQDVHYLDCGRGSWAEKGPFYCDPFHTWRDIYDHEIVENYLNLTGSDPARTSQFLGAELTVWSELAAAQALETRIFPRAIAFGERMWVGRNHGGGFEGAWEDAERRLIHQRERIVERGVASDVLAMRWCHQFENRCTKTVYN